MRVRIRVYDLLPEGKLNWALNVLGTGVYHSSVELAIPRSPLDSSPSPIEWAYGGHNTPGATGVFSIPAGTAAARMGPSLRPYLILDVGEAFGENWQAAFGPKKRQRKSRKTDSPSSSLKSTLQQYGSEATLAGPPYGGGAQASFTSPSQLSLTSTTVAEDEAYLDEEEENDWDDGGESDGTQYLTLDERRARRLIGLMKESPEWRGQNYRLLGHNCNSFTDELVWRLTGRRAPGWLNRAAWVATSIPCIVPPGWIDEADEAAPDAPAPTSPAAVGSTVVAAPPRADLMTVGRG